MDLGWKVSSARDVVKETLDGGQRAAVVYTGGGSSLVLLHLIKSTAGLGAVDVVYMQSRSMRPEMFYFMDKLSRLWSFVPHVERLPGGTRVDASPEEGISTEVADALRRRNCKRCLTPVLGRFEGGAFSSDKPGFIELRPLYLFSDGDVYRYIDKYRLPLCSLDLNKITSERTGAERREDEEEKVKDRLRSLGYL